MIYFVTTSSFTKTIDKLIAGLGADAEGLLSTITYEEILLNGAGPIGHYIFTDTDRLSRYESDCAAAFALALAAGAPGVKVLNHPLRVMERVPLLTQLHRRGINSFSVQRLDTGERPSDYPVFIRAADGASGSDTDVIGDEKEFNQALLDLARRGLPLKGRIAVGYVGEKGRDGLFRKYGTFRIGDAMVPQHVMHNSDWMVKRRREEASAEAVAEELAYVKANPHQDALRKIFQIAGIEFGRIDYGFCKGRMEVYEINTNPSCPSFAKNDARSPRRSIIRAGMLDAFRKINTPHKQGTLSFSLPKPFERAARKPRPGLLSSFGQTLSSTLFGRVLGVRNEPLP